MNKLCFLLTTAVSLLVTLPATAQTFSNSTPLNTPTSGAAGLYPSPIVVSGVSGPVSAIVVTIPRLASFDAGQAALMLVSPSGGKIILMRECGITANVGGGVSITLTDLGPAMPGFDSGFAGGTFRPTVNSGFFNLGFPAPAPAGPYSTTLNSLITADVNGTWSLYVADVFGGCCPTSLPSGWKISFIAGINAVGIPYQGSLRNAGSPVNGDIDLRFRLIDSSGNPVGLPCTKSAVSVSGGVFTTNLNQMGEFGPAAFQTPNYFAIETSVRNPADPSNTAPFVTLSPPTPLAMVPFAQSALLATSAPWGGITNVPANVSGAFSPWSAGPSNSINYTAGGVGIGTASPTRLLDVNGAVRVNGPIQNSTTPVSTGDMGLYNSLNGVWMRFTTNNAPIQFYTNYSDGTGTTSATPQMTLASGGNVGIGNSNPSQRLTVNGNVLANNVAVPSSIRFKDHVSTMDDALESLLKLEGVRFDWKPEWAKERPGREHDIGFVAEDVEKVFPEVVFRDENGNVTGMDYSRLTAVAVQAIKELKAENDALKARLERIEAKLK